MQDSSIAIVGMSCVFPGARNLEEYWSNMVGGVDATSPIPAERLNGNLNFGPALAPFLEDLHLSCTRGGFLPDDFRFDPLRYGVLPKNLTDGDPDQFFSIAIIDDALKDARITDGHPVRENCDVIIGRGGYITNKMSEGYLRVDLFPHLLLYLRQHVPHMSEQEFSTFAEEMFRNLPVDAGPDSTASAISNLTASRAANRLNLQGAAYTVDGACASSLLSVEHAVLRLCSHQCDAAVACGLHLCQLPTFWYVFQQLGALSAGNIARPFDRRADGILIGEGGGAVVLKRLADAQRDGDRVYAVIKGVGSSSDGRGSAILTPRSEGQVLALKRAYRSARIDPDSIGYLEAHGTGTPVGDPVEALTVKTFFGERKDVPPVRAMGSVKSMIGHTMTAAGIASLIRTALAVSNKILPPSLNCEDPTPALDGATFYINDRARPWIHDTDRGPRRGGINAFGFGGINVHVILEEVEESSSSAIMPRPFRDLAPRLSELIAAAADSREDLIEQLEKLTALRPEGPRTLAELSRTAMEQLDASKQYRLALVCTDLVDLVQKAKLCLDGLQDSSTNLTTTDSVFFSDRADRDGKVAAVFPGIGFPGVVGQYAENLIQLCLHFPQLRDVFDHIELRDHHEEDPVPTSLMLLPPATLSGEVQAALQSRVGSPKVEELLIGAQERPATQRNLAPAAVTAAGLAGWRLLQSLGVHVDVVVGQSMGELAAACAAEILEFRDVMRGLWEALAIVPPYRDDGRLAIALANERQIEEALAAAPDVQIAMYNTPEMHLLGGPGEQLDVVLATLRDRGVMANKLPFPPIHTPGGNYLGTALGKGMNTDLTIRQPRLPVYSSVHCDFFPRKEREIRNMALNVVNQSVRSWQTIKRAYDDGVRVFIETADGGLSTTVNAVLPESEATVVELHDEDTDGVTLLNRVCAALFVAGVPLDMPQLHAHRDGFASRVRPSSEHADNPVSGLSLPLRMSVLPFGESVFRKGLDLFAEQGPIRSTQESSGQTPAVPNVDDALEGHGQLSDDVIRRETQSNERTSSESAVLSTRLDVSQPVSSADIADASANRPSSDTGEATTDSAVANGPIPADDDVPKAAGNHEWPLLGDVLESSEGQKLTVERVLDLDRDLFLHDHVFLQVRDYKPVEECLPLLPLAAMVEAMAEAAACLVPGLGVIGLEQVRALRWVALLDEPTLPTRIEAHLDSVDDETGIVAVRTELSSNGEVNAMATVLLGAAYEQSIDISFSPRDGERLWPFTAEEFYHDGHTFHGPRLQCIAETLEAGNRGGDMLMEVLPVDNWFADNPHPQLLLDPVTLDGVAQAIAMWARGFGKYTLPMGFRKLELYRSTPPRGTIVPVSIEVLNGDEDARTFVFNIEVQDGEGNVWMRIEGFSLWVFEWTTRAIEAQRQPERVYLSEEKALPGQPADMILMTVGREEVPGGNIDWICRLCMTRPEIELINGFESPSRKWQWLYGRLAAKDAVRLWLKRNYGVEFVHPLGFAILNDDLGRPYVQLYEDQPGVPHVSITHLDGRSFAAAALAPVGVDVEHSDRQIDDVATPYIASEEEREFISSLRGPQDSSQVLLQLWCAKESVGKALGVGLNGNPKGFEAIDAEPDGRFLVHDHSTGERHVAQSWHDGPVIGAYALIDAPLEAPILMQTEDDDIRRDAAGLGITRASVIGAGTLGWRIAWQCALHDLEVSLFDTSADALDDAAAVLQESARQMVREGSLSLDEANAALSRVQLVSDAAAVADTDILCESVPEQLELKKEVFRQFHELCPSHTIFVTNTSFFLPSMIAEATGRPHQFAALHFHGNVWDTNVVDLMPHPGTDVATVDLLEEFARSIGQIPIIMRKQSYGYVVNAMLMNLNRVALTLAANDVATIDDIDRAFMAVMKSPVGPFGIMDYVGLDTSQQILDYWAGVFKDPQLQKNVDFLQQYLDQGFRGAKTGRGFYTYPDPLYEEPGFLYSEAGISTTNGNTAAWGHAEL